MKNSEISKAIKSYTFHIENAEFTLYTEEFHTGYTEFVMTHMHSFYEVFFVLEGCLKIYIGEQEICLNVGEVAIIPPRVQHRTVCVSKDTMPGIVNLVITQNSLHTTHDFYSRVILALQKPYVNAAYNQMFFEVLQKCYTYMLQENSDMISATFHEFMALILQYEVADKQKSTKGKPFLDSEAGRIHKINTFIYAHFREDIKIGEIAEALYLSERQVSRIIQNYYGCTLRELVTQNRMKLATEALRKSTMTVEEVAEYVGYNSICSFYVAFKKQFGTSPNAYRNSNSENK